MRRASRTFGTSDTAAAHAAHGCGSDARNRQSRQDHQKRSGHVAARGAPTQVISGGRSQWRNRSHGAYRCARKAAGGGVAYTRTHFSLLPTSGTSRARCATRAAPLRKSRRLAEFATKRSGLNKKKRSERRLCARTGDFVEKEEPSI